MFTCDSIKQIIEEQARRSQLSFLYKDKQLLKSGDYSRLAWHRLKESRRAFVSGIFFFLMFIFFGVSYFLQYLTVTGWSAVQVTVSGLSFLIGIGVLFYSTKEYYSNKSIIPVKLKFLDEEMTEESDDNKILERA